MHLPRCDCLREVKNERNKLRRRVKHEPIVFIECGRSFIPKRADALMCSNRCHQACGANLLADHRKPRFRTIQIRPMDLPASSVAG
jgi:hypothetical protein